MSRLRLYKTRVLKYYLENEAQLETWKKVNENKVLYCKVKDVKQSKTTKNCFHLCQTYKLEGLVFGIIKKNAVLRLVIYINCEGWLSIHSICKLSDEDAEQNVVCAFMVYGGRALKTPLMQSIYLMLCRVLRTYIPAFQSSKHCLLIFYLSNKIHFRGVPHIYYFHSLFSQVYVQLYVSQKPTSI